MRISLFLSALSILAASCTQHYYYAPNTLNLPTADEKGELVVAAHLSGSRQVRGFEATAEYAPLDKTSISLNYMRLGGSYTSSMLDGSGTFIEEQHRGNGNLLELGITRHFPISQYNSFTLTAGGGIGNSFNDFDRNRIARLNFSRYYIQPGFVSQGELANVGIGLRFSRLNFESASIDLRIDEGDLTTIQRIQNNTPFYMPDLGLTGGINFNPVQLRCHVLVSMSSNNSAHQFLSSNVSLSAAVNIHDLVKKGDKKPTTTKSKSKKKKKKK
jgi:hypothetical protein